MRGLAFACLLLGASGCAQRADWIEGTLVTVDVSGIWRGTGVTLKGPQGELEMTLIQRGESAAFDAFRLRLTRHP